MRYIFLFLYVLTNSVSGQSDRNNYLITIGKYSFRPVFMIDGTPGPGQFSAGDDGDLESYEIRFPKRSDTVLMYNPGAKPTKEVFVTDWYAIDLFVDSIKLSYIDTLLRRTVSVSYKSQPLQVYSLTFQIMYADGKRIHKTASSDKIRDFSDLLHSKLPYKYLLLSNITFCGNNKTKLIIDDIIGWKILGD
ncbi:MAG: hypothetical protein JNL60_17685 [Bacteroidia bacterium]|nr:hypothetical protein [Bacteroidia bacterium]